ncbi:hypothetical protein SSX86_012136 [Deinandra increscens subsp. villosa]|uniref:Uncharacterized protein n=1 Tax=Deinandra increscens subsp. villosa TaxID=3103831 RepID=A0AAP0H2Z8_9ASTR
MTRRCSHCSNNGHNSRTCPNRGVKLFGVRITDGSIRKSASMGNLSHYSGSGSSNFLSGFPGGGGTDLDSPGDTPDHNAAGDGYGSEDFVAGSSSGRERKKGVPWTEEEHRMFLLGLQKLGKGDWRGIARNFVITRTPTQVASHAQKYFIRQSNISRRKRRSSLFDIVADDSPDSHMMSSHGGNSSQPDLQSINNPLTIPTLEEEEEEEESMESANSNTVDPPVDPTLASLNLESSQYLYPVMFPAYVSPFVPVAIPYWPGPGSSQDQPSSGKTESHEVLKPTAVHSKSPINVDDLVGMSKLTLGESIGEGAPTSLKLIGGLSRQSAFHASNPGPRSSNMDSNHNPIHAV